MGNVLAPPLKATDFIGELPGVVLRDTLGGGRFLKTLLCVHDEGGLVVVKGYQKRADTSSLEPVKQQLLRIRAALTGLPRCHVWPWQAWTETQSAAYLLRQHLACSLSDRLSTRPFLSHIEKCWIAFQLLQGLAQAHEAGVCHGDLKTENVLLTSWHWLFIADWAPYKPTLLPGDNPADFSFYFDTGGRRRCYIAPERFTAWAPGPSSGSGTAAAAAGDPAAASDANGGSAGQRSPWGPLSPPMDVFSAGCVLAELFMDGRALFDLGTLLGCQRGEWDPATHGPLQAIEPGFRQLILHMIQLDPGARWSARKYLTDWQPALFPSYFAEVLHPFFDSLLSLDTDGRVAAAHAAMPGIRAAVCGVGGAPQRPPGATTGLTTTGSLDSALISPDSNGTARTTAALDARSLLTGDAPDAADDLSLAPDVVGPTAGSPGQAGDAAPTDDGQGGVLANGRERDGMVLLAVLLCTLLRGARLVESKKTAVQLLTDVALLCDEDVRLQCCVPYLITLLGDPCGSVRCLVLSCLVRLIGSVQVIPPSDAKVFQDYLLPALSPLPHDPEEAVRVEFAAGVASLAEAAHRHVLRLHHNSQAAALATAAALQASTSATPGGLRDGATPAGLGGGGPHTPATAGASAQASCRVSVAGVPGISRTPSLGPPGGPAGLPADSGTGTLGSPVIRTPDGKTGLTSTEAAVMAAVAAAAVGMAEAAGVRVDAELALLRTTVEKVVLELVTGMASSAAVKRSLLGNVGPLAAFYGRRELNNTLLPLIITCLNAQEWQLRSAFFHAVATIGPHTGRESLDVFLLPCMEQALTDSEVSVVCDAVRCVTAVAPHLRKRSLLHAARKMAPLVGHASSAVRSAAVAFFASAARALPAPDVLAHLCPLVTPTGHTIHPVVMRDEKLLALHLAKAAAAAGARSEEVEVQEAVQASDARAPPTGQHALVIRGGAGAQPPGQQSSTGLTFTNALAGQALGVIHEQNASGQSTPRAMLPDSPIAAAALLTSAGSSGRWGNADRARGPSLLAATSSADNAAVAAALSEPTRARTTLAKSLAAPASSQPLPGRDAAAGAAATPTIVDRLSASRGLGGAGSVSSGNAPSFALASAPQTAARSPPPPDSAQGLVLYPPATLHLMELPDTPAPVLDAAAAVDAGGGPHGSRAPSAAVALAAGPTAPPGSSSPRSLVDQAVSLLHPASSLHAAAIASIPARIAALETWVTAVSKQLALDPAGMEAAEKQQLERAAALLARLRGPTVRDIRSPSTLTTAQLANAAVKISPSLPSAAAAPLGSGATTGPRVSGPLGADGGPAELPSALSDAVAAAMSTQLGGRGPPGSAALGASLAHLSLSSLRSSMDTTLAGGAVGLGSGGASGGGGPLNSAADAGAWFGYDAAGAPWRPRGVLTAHMVEHRRAITRIAVARAGYAVTTSMDETAKVWDLKRLERDVSFHSRLTYAAQPGVLTSCALVETDASVATASAAGSVHVWRVEMASSAVRSTTGGHAADKYTGIVGVRQLAPGEGPVMDVAPWGPHSLMYLSQRGGVHAWDLRVKQDVWRLPLPASQGLVEHLVLEPLGQGSGACGWGHTGSWLLTGSSRGWVTAWDVRFMVPAQSWQHPMRCPIDCMALATAPAHRLGLSLGDGAGAGSAGGGLVGATSSAPAHPLGPLLYVAAGQQEMALWDVATASVVQVLRCLPMPAPGAPAPSPPGLPGALQPSLSATTPALHESLSGGAGGGGVGGAGPGRGAQRPGDAAGRLGGPDRSDGGGVDVLGVARLAQPTPRPPGFRALLPLSSGLLLSGSADRCIRCWDGTRPDGSYLVAGPLWAASDNLTDVAARSAGLALPQYKYKYGSALMEGVPVLEESCMLESVARFTESCQEIRQLVRVHEQCHGDALTHMTATEGLQGGRLLLTAARDGTFKAWK